MKNLLWLLVLVAVGCAQHADKKPQTQLTAITQASGGEMPEGQKNLHFSKAELHWQVFPEQQRIAGHAILTFKAKAALTRLSLD
ncbi:MAG: hypothetical protein LRY40_08650 [Shewanella fodinae]|nr:hypothetical protein [Shewanella fodinae]